MAVARREPCPTCREQGNDKNGNNLVTFENGSQKCFNCNYSGFSDRNQASSTSTSSGRPLLPIYDSEAIPHRGISLATAEKYNVFRMTRGGQRVTVFPYGPECQKVIGDDKSIYINGDYKKAVPMFHGKSDKLIITEGEYDCLSVSQVVGDKYDVVTLINGADSVVKFINDLRPTLDTYSEINLCFDNDAPGAKAVQSFLDTYGYERVKVISLPVKDANEMLQTGRTDELKTAIFKAKTPRPECVQKMSDIDDDFFNETTTKPFETSLPAFDFYMGGGIRTGELTMLAGGSGCGKSTFCTNLVYNILRAYPDCKIADIKLEVRQVMNAKAYMSILRNLRFRDIKENSKLLTDTDKDEYRRVLGNLYINKHFGSLGGNQLLSLLDYYATVEKVQFIVLDHITLAVSGMPSSREGERKDLDILVTKIRELINRTGVGIICVSQLNDKGESDLAWEQGKRVRRGNLRGSGSLQHLADNIISIEGDLTDPKLKDYRLVRIIKTREGDEQEVEADWYKIDKDTRRIMLNTGRV